MYIAQMYCYGKDPTAVGVDGISGCMGVFVDFADMLYAIHIVAGSKQANQTGADQFCDYVMGEAPSFDGKNARIIFAINQFNRVGYMDEVRYIGKKLGIPKVEIVHVTAVEKDATGADKIAVLCERHGGKTLVLKYQSDGNVAWETGGEQRAGFYHPGGKAYGTAKKTSGAVSQGWTVIAADNSIQKTSVVMLA